MSSFFLHLDWYCILIAAVDDFEKRARSAPRLHRTLMHWPNGPNDRLEHQEAFLSFRARTKCELCTMCQQFGSVSNRRI